MTQHLQDALRAEYELAHAALRPDGVAAVHAGAARRRRRQAAAGAAAMAVVLAGGVTAWRLAPGDGPAQVAGAGCDRPGYDVSVSLAADSGAPQVDAINQVLTDSPEPYCVTFENQEAAWERFKILFKDAPELIDATPRSAITASFSFRVAKPAASDAVEQRVRTLDGVRDYVCSCRVKRN